MAKKPSYSFSAIYLFDACKHAYKLVYREKVPRTSSDALKIGGDSHKLVEQYLTRLVHTGQQTDWSWAEGLFNASQHPEAQDIFRRFIESFIMPPLEAPGIEQKLAFTREWKPCGWFDDDVYFRLVIDFTYRQSGLAVIQDWKTNFNVPANIEKDLQLRIYGWAARKVLFPEVQEILLRLHFLRYGVEREVLLEPADLDTVPQELEAKIAEIEREKYFDPKPGSFCGWCGLTAHCPVMAKALIPAEVIHPVIHEDAVKAAALLLAIEQMDKIIKEHLKAYVKENGPIVVGDMVYGPSRSTTYDLPTQEVTEFLLNQGLEPGQVWPMVGISKTSLERGLKRLKRSDLLDEILASAPSKETEKVMFKKVR